MTKIFNRTAEKEKRRSLRNKMTEAEEMLWQELRNRKLGARFLRQFSIGSYVVDFYCPALKLAIEVDGSSHSTEDATEYDKNREKEIGNLEIMFARYTNYEVFSDINKVVNSIKNLIKLHTVL